MSKQKAGVNESPLWWKSIRESLRPQGLTFICPQGHELLIDHEAVNNYTRNGVEYLPPACPKCKDVV